MTFQAIRDVASTVASSVFRILSQIGLCGFALIRLSFQELVVLIGLGIMASWFGELRHTSETGQQINYLRVLYRTMEWGSLAAAGYIIVSILSEMPKFAD